MLVMSDGCLSPDEGQHFVLRTEFAPGWNEKRTEYSRGTVHVSTRCEEGETKYS